MSDDKKKSENALQLRIKRVRSKLAVSVKTGGTAGSNCPSRTDPTVNGYNCTASGGSSVELSGQCPTAPYVTCLC
jgi:hypothetical protein